MNEGDDKMKRTLLLSFAAAFLADIVPGMSQTFEYSVKHRHILKDCRGVLKINPEGVEYKTNYLKDSRKWIFADIRTFELKSADKISIITYEDQKRWIGKDKVFEFALLDKKATPELSAFLLSRIEKPMELAVLPIDAEKPAYEIAVKHLRAITGTRGVLRIYPDKVAYITSTAGDSRYWRISDIQRFSQPDRYRFEIVSYLPKAGGPTEVYNFQLIHDLPQGAYDYLWVRLHPSSYYPEIRR
jgi:hypothetical protein